MQYGKIIQAVRSARSVTTAAFCALAMLMLGGCAGLFIKQHGFAAPDAEEVRADGSPVVIPDNAPSIAQGYRPGSRGTPVRAADSAHTGIDIVGKRGLPVIAPAKGIVAESYYGPLFGNQIVIDHGRDESGRLIRSRHSHLDTRVVKKGDRVVRGQQIGTLGSTGMLASYPHLHYEMEAGAPAVRIYFVPVNPHRFWADGAGIVTCFDSSRQWADAPVKTTYPVPCV
jgi:murein DD-endopeptidase MepM/ murein hydrolase activator NlpD